MDVLENTVLLVKKYICIVEELFRDGKISSEKYEDLTENKLKFLSIYAKYRVDVKN